MSVRIIQDRLAAYNCRSTVEEDHALREITQEIVLAGLGRTDLFERAGFQGGTCLRVFHGLNRFSEDLDFALCRPDTTFVLAPYLAEICRELDAYGYDLEIDDRSKADQTVRKAFLKDDSIGRLLRLDYRPMTGPMRKLRVKLEVDTNPPTGASYDMPVLDYPFPSAVRVFDLPSLFAGKIHALLCRKYLKGRDWYDFIWYTARGVAANQVLLSAALSQVGPWRGQDVTTDAAWVSAKFEAKIAEIDWRQARDDVRRFLRPQELPSLELWSSQFFLNQCRKLV
ncbi:MAG: nucleotidyl transferase AbiEii/AbiGii toxin family protein [Victivallales bacterium]|jgi:predicted nucleotidyltransferase component of viral defense system|nr:nucleotidyl transferase AbiEii/AbiGii toxin family protein [Victivallales bacterium]